ncbi:fimbria/pilus outer membrane usher protein [Erythrobacter rubeus]|uniref:Fimbrial biogenesis outer membrane usher protein n=1 Tax=Erythrobacter rubeus TaxID=2760803 RepID=A0ABR8KRB9_9SPHN|nr:fimbria/pilus outer membrane usher protein [Erythrobacter rubeus]MBD2840994.1 fimbrial biogenesis outer membrane usher protein [Erythrobacter rubeus]
MSLDSAILATALISTSQGGGDAEFSPDDLRAHKAVALDLPVSLDGILLGEVVAKIRGTEVSVRPEDILALFDGEIDQATVDSVLASEVSAEGFATLQALAAAGLIIEYVPESLSLTVELAIAQRGVRQVSLRNTVSLDPESALQPAGFSAGITAINRVAHVHQQPRIGSEFEPFRSDVFGFVNVGGFDGWTLAWEANIETGRDDLFERRDVALIKDDFENATRLTIGDFRTQPFTNLQRSVDFVGVSFRRAYEEIQPFRVLRPSGRQSFTLERPARVTVEVDGLIAFDQQLPPGAYDLSDFPFSTGSNSAVIIVDDGAGPPQVTSFSAFIDNELLGEGLSRFDLSLGLLSYGATASPRYSDDPALSASYEVGVTTSLTLGAHIEASFDLIQVRGSVAIATEVGIVSGETSVSQSSDGWGASAAIQYRNEFETGALHHTVAAQVIWRNEHLQSLAGPEVRELSVDLRWLVQAENVQFSADASHRRVHGQRTRSLALGATWRMMRANFNARGQVVQREGQSDDYRATLSVSIPLGRRSRARARFGTDGDARLEYQRFGGFSVGESQFRAQISRDRDGFFEGSGQIRHISNRAELQFDHQTRETPLGTSSRSEITAAIGIGFAEGAVQFGRPFDSGFVIVKRHENISDRRASLDENGIGEAAHSDPFGAAFIPLRAGYSNYAFTVQVDDLEPGYDLGIDRVEVLPPFRAGYRVDIGSEIRATVLARLILPNEERVSLATGTIYTADGNTEVARFFTNRTGRLVVENLEPGTYRIRIDGSSNLSAEITIAEDETGIVQKGEIKLEPFDNEAISNMRSDSDRTSALSDASVRSTDPRDRAARRNRLQAISTSAGRRGDHDPDHCTTGQRFRRRT